MKRAAALVVIAVALSLTFVPSAHAGSSTDAALGLGAFAVFNQFLTGQTIFQQGFPPQRTVIVQQPAAVMYAPPPPAVVYAPPPPPVVYAPPPPVVVYPRSYVYAAPEHHWKHVKHDKRFKRHHRHDDD